MDRLTKRDEYGNADIIGVDSADIQLNLDYDGFNKVTDALNRLAAYEDTGLEPEEIKNLENGIIPDHWAEFFKAECEGRLIVLPCKVGDTVWGKYGNDLMPFTVKRIDDPLIHLSNDDEPISLQSWFPADMWGTRTFATREAAEAALGGDGDG